jgi:hypothetical protein
MITRYQENDLTYNVILNIEYHVALNYDIHTPSISEHQMLNIGTYNKKYDTRSNHCNFQL